MLEIKILKVLHETEEEARKLKDFLKECDVHSCESGASSIKNAEQMEKLWMENLKLSRTQFKKWVTASLSTNSPQVIAYGVKRDDYLFKLQRPMYVVERFDASTVAELDRELNAVGQLQITSQNYLAAKNVDAFLIPARQSLTLTLKTTIVRDRNMALNLSSAEGYLRERFTALTHKEPIKLVLSVGAMHFPEDYLSLPNEVISLYDLTIRTKLELKAKQSFVRTNRIEDREVLSYGISLLQHKRRMLAHITQDDLLALDFDNLKRKVME